MSDAPEGKNSGFVYRDRIGAGHEGGFVERLLWRIIGRTRRGERRWTDDTQMSLDVAESLRPVLDELPSVYISATLTVATR